MHRHFVHKKDGVACIVEDVVDEGAEGSALDLFHVGGGAKCARSANGGDGAGFFGDIKTDFGRSGCLLGAVDFFGHGR